MTTRSSPRRSRRPPRKYHPESSPEEPQSPTPAKKKTTSRDTNKNGDDKNETNINQASMRFSPRRHRRPPSKYRSTTPSPEDKPKASIKRASDATRTPVSVKKKKKKNEAVDKNESKHDGEKDGARNNTFAVQQKEGPVSKDKDTDNETQPQQKTPKVVDKVHQQEEKGELIQVDETVPSQSGSAISATVTESAAARAEDKKDEQATNDTADEQTATQAITTSSSTTATATAPPSNTVPPSNTTTTTNNLELLIENTCKRLEENNALLAQVDLSRKALNLAHYQSLSQALLKQTFLKKLVLSDCQLRDDSLQLLLNAGLTRLESLWLDGNHIGPSGAQALASWLGTAPSLKRLFMPSNRIGPSGAQAIASSLQSNPNGWMEAIDLGENMLGNDGATAFCTLLQNNKNRYLKELCLYRNNIGNPGAVALAQALQHNTCLRELDLRYNEIDNQDGILEFMNANTALETLLMVGNPLRERIMAKMGLEVVYFAGDVSL